MCIDMTKAFDNVKHSVLLEKLIHKGIPEIYIRLLFVMYDKLCANVKWNGSLSTLFTITKIVSKRSCTLSDPFLCLYRRSLQNTKKKEIGMLDKHRLLWHIRLCR